MKTFNKVAAQGEIRITKVESIPKDAALVKPENGKHIIGHSETGHHHVLERPAEVYSATHPTTGMKVLYAIIKEPNALVHERSFDTHEGCALEPGIYQFNPGREFDPYKEIARKQAD